MTDPRASTAERLYCCGSGARPGSLDSPSALAVRISPFLCTVAVFRHTRLTIVDPSAVLVDLSSYSLAVPVIPFRLQALGYGDIGGKTGWLVSAYAGGLIVSSPVVAVVGAKYKNRQIPLFLGLLFMAGAVVLFMEAESYGTSRVVLTRGRRSLY
jgi:MFS family permease